jgi:hypothetical protein
VNGEGVVMSEPGDYNCRKGAEAIAAAVRAYWTAQGHTQVQTWVIPKTKKLNGEASEQRDVVWCVRSNLVNGLPPE